MNSRHIPGGDGYAKVVDLVPLVKGKPVGIGPVFKVASDAARARLVAC